MKIIVINGSPKGELGVTLRYAQYIATNYPEHSFRYIHVAQRIKEIERYPEKLNEIRAQLADADMILWATPIYYLLVPAQLKRFFELLLADSKMSIVLNGKPCASITTSIHFYDHTGNDYLQQACEVLGMKFCGYYSAHSADLRIKGNRANLRAFFEGALGKAANAQGQRRRFYKLVPAAPLQSLTEPTVTFSSNKRIILLHDNSSDNLMSMVEYFNKLYAGKLSVYDINQVGPKSGCLGCCQCAFEGKCVIKDGFSEFYNSMLAEGDALIIAGTIYQDGYLSALWKRYFDRTFFKGHNPVMMGKNLAYIISGNLRSANNLQHILDAYAQNGGVQCSGTATDEYGSEAAMAQLNELARCLHSELLSGYMAPRTYLQVGSQKLFRDFIYKMRWLFRQDYAFWKKHRLFDFPKGNVLSQMGLTALTWLVGLPFVQRKLRANMTKGMIRGMVRIAARKER